MTEKEFSAISALWKNMSDIREALDSANQVRWVIPTGHMTFIDSYKIDASYPRLQAKIKRILRNADNEIKLALQQEMERIESKISEITVTSPFELIEK